MSYSFFGILKGLLIQNEADKTKQVKIQSSSSATTGTTLTITAAQTADRTITIPNATDTLVGKATTDTLTNKTLNGNTATNLISGSGTMTLNISGTVTLPNATDTLVGKATTDILTNKTLNGNTATNLISGSGTLTLNTSGTATVPNATDTLVGKATTDTLTNKTISGSSNTLSSIAASSLTGTDIATVGTVTSGTWSATTIALNKGGTGQTTKAAAFDALQPMTTLGDVVYGGASGTGTRLAGDTSNTRKFLRAQSSSGTAAAPAWDTIASGDVPTLNQNTTGTALNVTGTVAIANGGTGQTSKAAAFDALQPMSTSGDIIYGGTSGTGTRLAKGSDGQVLALNSGLPVWSTSAAFSNPMTTLGDAIVGGASGVAARLAVGSNGQFVGADSTATNGVSWQNPSNFRNHLVNGAFDYWQVNTSVTAAQTAATYGADQWFINNQLGTSAVITLDQQTGVTNGSKYGARVKITTAPTAAKTNTHGLYQTLSNQATFPVYNQTASFSILVKALGNVNQIGVQFQYATSEVKASSAIGSAVLTTVNTSTFTSCTTNGQALGTSATTSGVIGVVVYISGVSSGNIYDLNNGFIVEQAMFNLGPVALPFSRQNASPAEELAACQYFYEKSYDLTVVPGTSSTNNGLFYMNCSAASAAQTVLFKVTKRAAPTMTAYSPSTGTSGKYYNFTGTADGNATLNNIGFGSFLFNSLGSDTNAVGLQWVADARM